MTMPDHRQLDHLVLPVSTLAAARERLTALGFTVAPNGVHPFGTANCCVFFADGTFLEPLAVVDRAVAGAATAAGNVFVGHDRNYRLNVGEDGFSAVVFGTQDAARDHALYADAGISAGDLLDFSREFTAPDGTRDRAAFRLAFAHGPQAPDCLFFTCERVAVPQVDRAPLQRHANGVAGIAEVLMTAPEPDRLAKMLEQIAGEPPELDGDGLVLRRGAFALRVLKPADYSALTGLACDQGDPPRFRAVEFACGNVPGLRAQLEAASIRFHETTDGPVVPPGQGQGVTMLFRPQTFG